MTYEYEKYTIIGKDITSAETHIVEIGGDVDFATFETYIKQSREFIGNKKLKNDFKSWICAGDRFINFEGEQIPVTVLFCNKSINSYIWSLAVLSGTLKQYGLPTYFVDTKAIIKKYNAINALQTDKKNIDIKQDLVFEFLVAINNATRKNESILKANRINYKPRDVFKMEQELIKKKLNKSED